MYLCAIAALATPACALNPPREAAPNFRAKSIDGEQFSKDSLKGKVVFIQFWTTWCGYCRRDQPEIDELSREVAERGMVFLKVSVAESRSTVSKYLAGRPRTPKIVLNEDTNLPAMFQVSGFPHYVVIDKDGKIAGVHRGAGGADALRRILKKLESE